MRTNVRLSVTAAAAVAALVSGGAALAKTFIAGNYYEDVVSMTCATPSNCRMPFTVTPTGKFLTIKRLTCKIPINGIVEDIRFGVAATAAGAYSRQVPLDYRLRPQGGMYILDQEMNFKIPARQVPRLEMVDGIIGAYCNLTGELSAT